MTDDIQIFIVEDDAAGCDSLTAVLEARGFSVKSFRCGEDWLKYNPETHSACAILDLNLGKGLSGLEVLQQMSDRSPAIPVIMISAFGDIRTAVTSMRLGATDFIEKPFEINELVHGIESAVRAQGDELALQVEISETERLFNELTERERTILELVCEGTANKVIANRLALGLRTVEGCRASLLKIFGTSTWPELIAKVIRLETYRAKPSMVAPPKFLERQDLGTQGLINGDETQSEQQI